MATDLPTITILKPGTFTDVRGTKVTFTEDDLRQIADSYDAESDAAPLVVGHPAMDAPAYGWVGRVEYDGARLVARPSEVAPAFAESVRAGHYRKISPELYPPTSASNPKPGSWYLKHVGFLGAAAPAIKGLGRVSLAAADDADAFTPELELSMADTPDPTVALAERDERITSLEGELEQLREAARLRAEADAQAVRDRQHAENVAFAEGLIAAATLAPSAKDRVIGLMDQLSATDVVSFGEGEGGQLTPLAAFRSLFDAAQPVISLGEHAPRADAVAPGTVTVSFAAPPGYGFAPDQAALANRAQALQASEPGLSFWDAYSRARTEAAGS